MRRIIQSGNAHSRQLLQYAEEEHKTQLGRNKGVLISFMVAQIAKMTFDYLNLRGVSRRSFCLK
jgi:hypothetical protein